MILRSSSRKRDMSECETSECDLQQSMIGYFRNVAQHNLVDDLSVDSSLENLQRGKIPALCTFSQEIGIDSNNCFTLFGRAYTRTKLIEWIQQFFDKTEMPTCPVTRQTISHEDLELLGFKLEQFRAFRHAQIESAIVKRRCVATTVTATPPNTPSEKIDLFDLEQFSRTSNVEIAASIFRALRDQTEPLWSCATVPVHLLQFYRNHFNDLLNLGMHTSNFPLLAALFGAHPREFPWSKILFIMLGAEKPESLSSGFCFDLFRECNVAIQSYICSHSSVMCVQLLLENFTNIARTRFATTNDVSTSMFMQSGAKLILETLVLNRFAADLTLPEFLEVIRKFLQMVRDVFPGELRCIVLLKGIFEYICKCNSAELLEIWLDIVENLPISLDELSYCVDMLAKYDADVCLPRMEQWFVEKHENFVFPLNRALFVAIQHFSHRLASVFFARKLTVSGDDESFADAIQHAIESDNVQFLSASYLTAVQHVTAENLDFLMELAVRYSSLSVVQIVVCEQFITNVVQWCDLLEICPVNNVDSYGVIWKAGKNKCLRNVQKSDWLTICNACYGSLLSSLRKSNYVACALWLKSIPDRFFENQFGEMMLNACCRECDASKRIFSALIRERNKRLAKNDFDYYFSNGALIRKASSVGATYVVQHVLAVDISFLTRRQFHQLLLQCIIISIRNHYWRVFEHLFRKARTCEVLNDPAVQQELSTLLAPFSSSNDANFLRAVVSLNAY